MMSKKAIIKKIKEQSENQIGLQVMKLKCYSDMYKNGLSKSKLAKHAFEVIQTLKTIKDMYEWCENNKGWYKRGYKW